MGFGLKAYVFSQDRVLPRMYNVLYSHYAWYGIEQTEASVVYDYVKGDDFWVNLSEYQFFLGPGKVLGDNLSGCAFLMSDKFKLLFNVDLCSTGNEFRSLRMVCARTCDCASLPIQCPSSCRDD